VQLFEPHLGDGARQGLADELMRKAPPSLGSTGRPLEQMCLFRVLERGRQLVPADVCDSFEEIRIEVTANDSGGNQRVANSAGNPPETLADDGTDAGRDVNLVETEIPPPAALRVEQPSLFVQMPEEFFDKKRIAAGLIEERSHERRRRIPVSKDGEHRAHASL
jgi:hypothetical protein